MFDFKLNQFQKFLFANSTICYLDKYPCLAFHSLPFKCSRYKGTTPHWLYCRKLFRLQSSLQIILNKSNLHFERQRKSPFTYISHTILLQKPDTRKKEEERNRLVCTTTTTTLNKLSLVESLLWNNLHTKHETFAQTNLCQDFDHAKLNMPIVPSNSFLYTSLT